MHCKLNLQYCNIQCTANLNCKFARYDTRGDIYLANLQLSKLVFFVLSCKLNCKIIFPCTFYVAKLQFKFAVHFLYVAILQDTLYLITVIKSSRSLTSQESCHSFFNFFPKYQKPSRFILNYLFDSGNRKICL